MQTFLPYADFIKSASCLDTKRLGKQRVETLQLLKALNGDSKGWAKHPASIMWRGYEKALILYGVAICNEWKFRGYKDTCSEKILSYCREGFSFELPFWFGKENFHASHRSNLLRKDFKYYSAFGWTEPLDLPYIWPRKD